MRSLRTSRRMSFLAGSATVVSHAFVTKRHAALHRGGMSEPLVDQPALPPNEQVAT
jgi:hypothetical protein